MPHQPTSAHVSPRAHGVYTSILGAAVRELRARRALSQEQLGLRARLHRNYVGAIERGEINPTLRTMRMLASGLDVELSALIGLCEERERERAAR